MNQITVGQRLSVRADPDEKAISSILPRLGFLGVGWIGRNRLQAVAASGLADIAVIADPVRELAIQATEYAPKAAVASSLDEMLEADVDGIVIATPSALHTDQTMRALGHGLAVFCQKPLGRNAQEACAAVEAARTADRLLGVDLSYRFTQGMRQIRDLAHSGELGNIFAADLVFHNAYGPNKPWFYERALSGGGCVIDLGIHLVDLGLWTMGQPAVSQVSSRLFAGGKPLEPSSDSVEDYATARLDLETGATINLACSWNLAAGRDAVISATFYGTKGGASFYNVSGSFYDFASERFRGTKRELLSEPPDAWSGRAIVDWVERLARGSGFDPQVESVCQVSAVLDKIYGH